MPNALESMGWTSIDDSTWDRTLVATRGERLALIEERVRFVTRDAGPAEIAAVSVLESTEDGKALRSTAFDPDDLDAAYDELDRRYVDQGGPDMRTPIQAQMQQDWDTFREVFAPTAIITDHRWAGLDRMDRDGFIAYNQQGPLVFGADVRPSADHVRVGGTRAMLVVGKDTGSHGGGAFEVTMVVVHQLDRAGRIDRSDLYDLEHLAEAWAHYERLVAGAAGTTVEPNLAWRVSDSSWTPTTRAIGKRSWRSTRPSTPTTTGGVGDGRGLLRGRGVPPVRHGAGHGRVPPRAHAHRGPR